MSLGRVYLSLQYIPVYLFHVLQTILQIGLVAFHDTASTPPGNSQSKCYKTVLAKATPNNRKYLKTFASTLEPAGGTQYKEGISAAFNLFEKTKDDIHDKTERGTIHTYSHTHTSPHVTLLGCCIYILYTTRAEHVSMTWLRRSPCY